MDSMTVDVFKIDFIDSIKRSEVEGKVKTTKPTTGKKTDDDDLPF